MVLGFIVLPASSAAGYVGVTGLEITPGYVHVESAYPTSYADGGYFRHYDCPYFANVCPHCGGSLSFEQCDPANGVIPGFTSIEGMYYCTSCDMDFSCISGMEHGSTGYCLYYYVPPEPEPVKEEKVEKPTHKIVEYNGPIKSYRLKVPIEIAEKLNI